MMLEQLQLEPGHDTSPGLAVFHTRLGLSVIDATSGIEHPAAHRIATDLLHHATTARDGYTARDLRSHHDCVRVLTDRQATTSPRQSTHAP